MLFRVLLVDFADWWWKVEGRQAEVEVAEVAGANVLVLPPFVIRVCQDVGGSSAFEVFERCGDVPVGEVNEAIATENYIRAWQFVSSQVE